jgi:hypothetical protein
VLYDDVKDFGHHFAELYPPFIMPISPMLLSGASIWISLNERVDPDLALIGTHEKNTRKQKIYEKLRKQVEKIISDNGEECLKLQRLRSGMTLRGSQLV